MKIAIVDDLPDERSLLKGRLAKQLRYHNVPADFFEYASGEEFLEALNTRHFTVVFLDIYMNGKNGIETARELRKLDPSCLLVFTTASADHALEGFQVRAMHYLVKPYTEETITALINELLSRIPKPDRHMEIKVDGSSLCLHYQSIVYAEHFAHLIYIHTTAQRTLTTRMPFKTFIAPLIDDPRFFVCGRGSIVNLEHAIDFEEAAFRMDEGSHVFVSQDLLKSARQAFMEYLLERGHMP